MHDMRPEVKRWFKIVFCTLMVVFSVSIGFSDWVYPDNSGDKTSWKQQPTQSEKIPVAYLSTNPDKKYLHLEDALNVAAKNGVADRIYVIPKSSAFLPDNQTYTIKQEDSLILPYEGEQGGTLESAQQLGGTIARNDSSKYLQSVVKIGKGTTINNYGTIDVAGIVSGGGGGMAASGQTGGAFCKITLGFNAKINNYNSIKCSGFIEKDLESMGTGSDERGIYSYSGNIELPFIIRDFRGGNTTLAQSLMNTRARSSYFNQFEISNISVPLTSKKESTITCHVNITASKQVNHSAFALSGGQGLFRIQDTDSYLFMDNNQETDGITTFITYGNVNMEDLSVSLGPASVSSSKFDIPLSFRQRIICKVNSVGKGSVNLPYSYKVLPGGYLKIEQGVTLTCNDYLYVYDESQYPSTDNNGTPYPSSYASQAGTFIMNGNAQISKFAGKIHTEVAGATLRVGSRGGHEITIVEITGKSPVGTWVTGYSDAKKITGRFQFQVSSTGAWKNGAAKTDYRSKKGNSCYGFE